MKTPMQFPSPWVEIPRKLLQGKDEEDEWTLEALFLSSPPAMIKVFGLDGAFNDVINTPSKNPARRLQDSSR